uniref:ABC transporter domain-containing protein n=1 Tax=Oryza meridionalis TaxID=40149 RepID=A0A0E0D450_9ORYZ
MCYMTIPHHQFVVAVTEPPPTVASRRPALDNLSTLLSTSTSDGPSSSSSKKKRSSIPTGLRLDSISKSYKGVTRGEKVRLVGVNSASKTTQLRIIAGLEDPDTGNVVKAKENMRIASLSQEFEVCVSLTVREEFLAAFEEEMEVRSRLEKVQAALEGATEDMDLMGRFLDELDLLRRRSQDVEVKIQKLMPKLGIAPRTPTASSPPSAAVSVCIYNAVIDCMQDPDLVLLDEPINHVDLDTIVWQEVPMVFLMTAFLDQLCTKIVETEFGMSKTHKANYSEYVLAKAIWVETQYATWEKQQEEIEQTKELINRLGAGVNAGRVSSEQKVVFF